MPQPAKLLLALLLPSLACAQDAVPKKLTYSPEYTVDQILNGEAPGRKPEPPSLPVTFDATGFAQDRVFHVPAVGVHPRIYFAPQDIPSIKSRLQTTEVGKQMYGFVKTQLANGIDKPGTWQNDLLLAGEKGDLPTFKKLYRHLEGDVTVIPPDIAPPPPYTPSTKWHQRDVFDQEIELKAFVDLLEGDHADGQRVAKVLVTMSRLYEPVLDTVDKGPYRENWWRTIHDLFGTQYFTNAYDWDFNDMTPAQQAAVRHTIARMTSNRYTLGMDMPAHMRVWNFIGLAIYQQLQALAIEGEPGYDPRIYKRGVEIIRDFFAYAVNPSGMAHESIGYHTAGVQHMTHLMIAMANRGDNYFTQSHYRASFDQWYVQALQPYGHEWFSDGDLGNFPPGAEQLIVDKYFFPNDPKLDFVLQNTAVAQKHDFATDFFIEAALITASDLAHTPKGDYVDYKAGTVFNLPPTYTDEHRGVVITRSDWSPEALYMNFECHPDTTFASHDHADRGRFVLSGAGRNWAWQDSRPHETGDTSAITIDGVGQGFFATPAKYLGMIDKPQGTFAACDASYAYDYKWLKEIYLWDPNDPRLNTRNYARFRAEIAKVDRSKVEYDPTPNVVNFYSGYLAGNPLLWGEDSWVARQSFNPVLHAYRTAGLVRGNHPYALIVDDIQKDATDHLYTWLMSLEPDVILLDQKDHDGVYDILLGDKTDKRLLVRILDIANPIKPYAEHYVTTYKLQGNAPQTPDMYRLVIPSKSVSPNYKVLLYAFHQGDPLPTSRWNDNHTAVSVEWTDEKDSITFVPTPGDKTKVAVTRGGSTIAIAP